jgi:hypothetical protein
VHPLIQAIGSDRQPQEGVVGVVILPFVLVESRRDTDDLSQVIQAEGLAPASRVAGQLAETRDPVKRRVSLRSPPPEE